MESYADKKLYGLTGPQQLIYVMQSRYNGRGCTLCCALLMKGQRPEAEITAALNELFRINDALRTRIVHEDGMPRQYIADYEPQRFEVMRLQSDSEIDAFAEEELQRGVPFDGQLCELRIIQLPDRYGVFVTCHHIITDVWGIAVLGNQFIALMHGETPEAYTVTDFFERDAQYRASGRAARDRQFFIDQYNKIGEPRFFPIAGEGETEQIGKRAFTLPADDMRAVEQFAAERNASPFAVMFAALSVMAARHIGKDAFLMALMSLNRVGHRERHSLGMHVESVPAYCSVDPDASFADHVAATSAELLATMRHAQYGYAAILTDLFLEHNMMSNAYDMSLNAFNARIDTRGGAEIRQYPYPGNGYGLHISTSDLTGSGELRMEYSYRISPREPTIDELHAELVSILMDGVAHEDRPLRELGR